MPATTSPPPPGHSLVSPLVGSNVEWGGRTMKDRSIHRPHLLGNSKSSNLSPVKLDEVSP